MDDGGSQSFPLRSETLRRTVRLLLPAALGVAVGHWVADQSEPLLPLVLVAMVVGAVVMISRLELGLLALVFITYTNASEALTRVGLPSIAKPLVAGLLGLVALRWAIHAEKPKGWGHAALILTIYGLARSVSILNAMQPETSLDVLAGYVKEAVVVLAICLTLQTGQALRRVTWTLLAASIFIGALNTHKFLTGNYEFDYWGFARLATQVIGERQRIGGFIHGPNYFALFMAMLIPLAIDRAWNERERWMKGLALLSLSLCIMSILATFSRGGFLALCVALGLMLVRRPPRLRHALVAVALALALVPFIPSDYFEHMDSLKGAIPGAGASEEAATDGSFQGRMSEMIVAMLMFRDHPVIGVGLGNYRANYMQYKVELGLDSRWEARDAHSLYLEKAAETGLIGLAGFALLILSALRGARTARLALLKSRVMDEAALVAAYMTSLVVFLFGSIFLHESYARFSWLMIGIVMALPQVADAEVRAKLLAGSPPTTDLPGGGPAGSPGQPEEPSTPGDAPGEDCPSAPIPELGELSDADGFGLLEDRP
jgi:O-antigen ligase